MKPLVLFASALSLLFPCSAVHASQKQDKNIVVSAPTLRQWTTHLSTALDRNLQRSQSLIGNNWETSVVSVRFQRSEDGRPTLVTVHRKSGTRLLDVAATRAVASLETLNPMPAGLAASQVYEANILFARSQDDLDRQLAILRKEAETRNRWADRSDNVIAINASPGMSGGAR